MRNYLNKMLYRFLNTWGYVFSRPVFQKPFTLFHLLALSGMNFGGGDSPKESGEMHAIRSVLNETPSSRTPVIFDVGANVGSYSALLLQVLGDRPASIHAFEPSRASFEKLRANLGQTNIVFHHIGFGDKNQTTTLYFDTEEAGLASVYQRRLDHFKITMGLSEEIEIRTIDSFCAEHGIQRIDFLKLDVEGFELHVLKGAQGMLRNGSINNIQFEFGSGDIDSRTFFQDFFYLLRDQYTIYRILKNGLYPIHHYQETYEVFITTNYLAKRKGV